MQHILGIYRPAADEIVVTKRARNDHDLVLDEQVPELLECLAEQADFHATAVVIEDNAQGIDGHGADFKQGHIVDALHIPASKLAERAAELEKYKDKPIVLVCKMGQQSGAAGKQLRSQGFDKVYKMTGGMMEWGNLQLPLVK